MNTNLAYIPSQNLWVKQSMPRLSRSVRGTAQTFSCNARHHLFQFVIAAGDPLIGQRAMIKFHLSMHDCTWGEARNWYVNADGPVKGISFDGNTDNNGTGVRLNVGEWFAGGSFPNGGGRRGNVSGSFGILITGAGSITVGFNCDSQGNTWTFRDDDLEQTNCVLYPMGA